MVNFWYIKVAGKGNHFDNILQFIPLLFTSWASEFVKVITNGVDQMFIIMTGKLQEVLKD